jgi:hypothetical protein
MTAMGGKRTLAVATKGHENTLLDDCAFCPAHGLRLLERGGSRSGL